jgi:class 3 adenylate cyclase
MRAAPLGPPLHADRRSVAELLASTSIARDGDRTCKVPNDLQRAYHRRVSAGVVEWWQRTSRIGTEGLPLEEARKARALNQFVVVAMASVLGYAAAFVFLDARALAVPAIVNVATAVVHATSFSHMRSGRRDLAVAQFLVVSNGQLAFGSWFAGPAVGFHYYFFAFATVVFLIVPRRLRWLYPFSIASTVLFVWFAFFADPASAHAQIQPLWATILRIVTVTATGLTLGLIAYLFDDDAIQAEQQLAVEHERSESLLLNILPPSISDRLKGGQKAIADGFAEVTVLFADIVGFTELSARMPPADLVRVLNEVFSRFDELAERHGLEKIKTIGDAYMAAAGLPEPRADHAIAAVSMALDMKAALAQVNREQGTSLEVRIGLNSGPVVAGVIGKKKFIYDLWGDTVNTASRMESHGVKGTVHLSEATAKLVEGRFALEERGSITVKGKGEMRTFLVREAG